MSSARADVPSVASLTLPFSSLMYFVLQVSGDDHSSECPLNLGSHRYSTSKSTSSMSWKANIFEEVQRSVRFRLTTYTASSANTLLFVHSGSSE